MGGRTECCPGEVGYTTGRQRDFGGGSRGEGGQHGSCVAVGGSGGEGYSTEHRPWSPNGRHWRIYLWGLECQLVGLAQGTA